MTVKKLIIETTKQKYYFEIDEYGGKYYLHEITYGGWLGDSKRRNKTGESNSIEDAVTLAKASVSGSFKNMKME